MSNRQWLVMADPIHGILRFDRKEHELLLEITNSRPFQRLRRVRQMGLAEFVFPGAVHSRFLHCLGALYLMTQTVEHLSHDDTGKAMLAETYEETGISLKDLLLVSILLHDIGHSPLSHTLEMVLELDVKGLSHDHYWLEKILLEDPDLQAIWNRYNPQWPHALLDFMGRRGNKHCLASLVSSQLDMDRLDYLLRDSHFLGTNYGLIELDRLLGSIRIAQHPSGQPVVAMREEAIPALEHYLFGRHQAYKMALHSLDKASEALLKKTLERFQWCREQGVSTGHPAEELYQLMHDGHALTTAQYLRMDDFYLWEAIHCWSLDASDPLLKELANRLLRHDLLKFMDLAEFGIHQPLHMLPIAHEALRQHYEQRGLSFAFGFDETTVKPKAMYKPHEPIWVTTRAKGVVDLSEVSSLTLSVSPNAPHKHLVFLWDKTAKHFLRDLLIQRNLATLEPLE
ncbi:MAG: hypothetical protein SFZ03_04790 [Candidatus Melainabacteria bacterium]|nr:hypothetical protein [Candidatus Melainabacteria bacterium]